MIEFRNLSKTYKRRNGKPCVALKGINLTLPDKGLVFIIGKSGSGKSTLLNLLGGLDTITEGDIIAETHNVNQRFCEIDVVCDTTEKMKEVVSWIYDTLQIADERVRI